MCFIHNMYKENTLDIDGEPMLHKCSTKREEKRQKYNQFILAESILHFLTTLGSDWALDHYQTLILPQLQKDDYKLDLLFLAKENNRTH